MSLSRLDTILVHTCYASLGWSLLSLELIWGRMTALPLGSSIHAYSITLAAVMAGLFCGTWQGNRMSRNASTQRVFASALLFTLAAGMATVAFVYLSEVFTLLRFDIGMTVQGAYTSTLMLVCLLVFIPSAFSGSVFPIATQLLVPAVDRAGSTAGTLYMMNSVGAIVGCVATGFILIEQLGLKYSAMICVLIPAIPSMIHFVSARNVTATVFAFILVPSVLSLSTIVSFPKAPFSVYLSNVSDNRDDFDRRMNSLRVLEERESLHGFTRVLSESTGSANTINKFLQVNNKNESSFMGADLPTQAFLALLPRIYLDRDPERFLDIGLGTGTTVWVAHKWSKKLYSIEINEDVYDMFATHFFPELGDDPRIEFIFQEARFYLQGSKEKYDIITMEPSYPTDGVTASLYTVESFTLIRDSLSDDGLLSLFIPVHLLGNRFTGGIVKTLMVVFSHVQIWNVDQGGDVIVVAGMQPFKLTPDQVLEHAGKYRFPHYGSLAHKLEFAQPNEDLEFIRNNDDYPVYTDDEITLELAALRGFLR